MKQRVQTVINKIRPMLQADGGDVELVDVKDGVEKYACKVHAPDAPCHR